MTTSVAKLALGTAQFGLDYGATGPAARPDERAVAAIVEAALAAGVDTIDTAAAYGDAESRLGRCLPPRPDIRIVTKIAIGAGCPPAAARDALLRSLDRLRRASVDAVLLHEPGVLAGAMARPAVRALEALRDEGLCRRIGISVYGAADIAAALRAFAPEIVQLPLNLFDQRLAASGWIGRLAARGVEVHARSVFLQGILLSPLDRLPAYFAPLAPRLARLDVAAGAAGATRLAACLAYALQQPSVARVVLGVQSAADLDEILGAARRAAALAMDFAPFACDEPAMVDPRTWPAREVLRASPLERVQTP